MINYTDFQNIQLAISAYADEMYTNARRINSTAIVGGSEDVRTDGESFIGQLRWYKPIQPNWNTPSFTNAADGTYTDITTDTATYIKSFHALGGQQHNLQELISRQDGLAKFARDQVQLRADREHDSVLSTLKGIAGAETSGTITGGINTFDVSPSATVGMFVDLNAAGAFGDAAVGASTARRLFDSAEVGAARGERLFRALGMGFKDYEPEYMYLLTSPELIADFRAANLVDEDRVEDGNLKLQTLFGGMFRLIQTSSSQGNFSSSTAVNDQSTKTSFLIKQGSIVFKNIEAPVPVEIDRDPAKYLGSGITSIWYRFGFINHPLGYSWAGATDRWATPASLGTGASWTRKLSALNLSVLPIFHS